MEKERSRSSSFGILSTLTIIFVIAKLLGVITWSWWLVLAPAILQFVFGITIFVIVYIVAIITTSSKR